MKIYILRFENYYTYGMVLGVFKTREGAEACIEAHVDAWRPQSRLPSLLPIEKRQWWKDNHYFISEDVLDE